VSLDACLPRSRGFLLSTVAARDVEHHYVRNELGTHCGEFVRDVCGDMGAPMPRPVMYANEQIDWLFSPAGYVEGWTEVETANEASDLAEKGELVLATYRNPVLPPKGHSHIAVVVPAIGAAEPHVAQAGGRNFSNEPLSHGFGDLPVRFAHHR
jgi:hypothetical protein